jgi:hypothetical protein
MPRKRIIPSFGSVSSGTLRTEDLLSALESECRAYGGRRGKALAREWEKMTEEETEGEEGGYLLEEMTDLLNDLAPSYGYFGAHPGDGADFGFWLSEDWEREAKDSDALFVNDLSEVPSDYRGEVFQVSDHGNVTLYTAHHPNQHGRFTYIWGIV